MEGLLNPVHAEVRVEFGMAEAEVAQRAQWRASAAVFRAIERTLREAAAHPEVFVASGDVEFAERAAVADLAVRLSLAESTVRSHAHIADSLRTRLPQLWAWFCEGEVSTQNAREAASIVGDMPSHTWASFDDLVTGPARTLAPARFTARARALRDRIHTVPLQERHETAMHRRGVWAEPDSDGMGWLHALLPSDRLAMAMARIDGLAADNDDDDRTMPQRRADVLADLLVGQVGRDVVVTVALTIPALGLLNGEGTATMEGAGPIDIATARILCAAAPSFARVLTDPFTSAILDLDRSQYRPSAALKRWLALRDVTCVFPGCGRAASGCDLDHTTAWADGGVTSAENLAHLCRKHHRLKHETRWKVERPPGSPPIWTSPTGFARHSDPPPF